jgi:hypothetical protein
MELLADIISLNVIDYILCVISAAPNSTRLGTPNAKAPFYPLPAHG